MTTILVGNNGAGSYAINGQSNPAISLIRGNTYYLNINANGHPFWIQSVPGGYSGGNVYSAGVTGNGSQTGTITFVVQNDAPNTLYYACQYHSSMQGSIIITDPVSTPPTIGSFNIPTQNYSNGSTFTITSPSSNSTGAFSFVSSDTSVATVSGSIVTILKAGTITITATQAASGNYMSGTATASLTITSTVTDYVAVRSFSMSSSFTNNAQVYYKPNSLSTSGGGSGVTNHRHKLRRT